MAERLPGNPLRRHDVVTVKATGRRGSVRGTHPDGRVMVHIVTKGERCDLVIACFFERDELEPVAN